MLNDSNEIAASGGIENSHVAVIGGGISGLAMSYCLSKSGARVTLYVASIQLWGHAKETTQHYFHALAGINPFECVSREALARLPLTRKRDLIDLQKKAPPFGGLNSLPRNKAKRVFSSPGPIYELQGKDIDPWHMARVLYAAGFRNGDLIHNCFSYHFTPGAFIFEGGARKLGCSIFPGGTGQTEQQVQAMEDLRPEGYVGTPSFLRIIIEKAEEMGADIRSLRKASVSGEALPGVTRSRSGRGPRCPRPG